MPTIVRVPDVIVRAARMWISSVSVKASEPTRMTLRPTRTRASPVVPPRRTVATTHRTDRTHRAAV